MGPSLLFGVVLLATALDRAFCWRVELPHARLENGVRVSYQPYQVTWTAFKNQYGRRYNTSEDQFRYRLFLGRLKVIEEHNKKYVAGETTYSMDISSFSDLKKNERDARTKCLLHHKSRSKRSSGYCVNYNRGKKAIPSYKDWRDSGCVGSARDQGDCGSCYAFAVVASVETELCRKTGELTELSPQQIVDCCGFGCDGVEDGSDIFKCVVNQGGLMAEDDYTYTAEEGECMFNKRRRAANVTGCWSVSSEKDMRYAVAFDGVLYGEVKVPDDGFMHEYHDGVYICSGCQSEPDHCISIVGFGETANGLKYWMVKNSWGEEEHTEGFIKIARGSDSCCIESSASYLPGPITAGVSTPLTGPRLAYVVCVLLVLCLMN